MSFFSHVELMVAPVGEQLKVAETVKCPSDAVPIRDVVEQHKHQDDQQHDAHDTTGTVAPTPGSFQRGNTPARSRISSSRMKIPAEHPYSMIRGQIAAAKTARRRTG
jgi:hypothetical protein